MAAEEFFKGVAERAAERPVAYTGASRAHEIYACPAYSGGMNPTRSAHSNERR
jgi:hypothetical protein